MEELTIYQGTTQPLTLDLAGKGTVSAVEFKIFKHENGLKTLDSKHKYPSTTGWEIVTKAGDNYTLTLTSTITDKMLGAYGVEATYTTTESGQIRAQTSGITVLSKVG
jgi:hypothetical protein